LRSFAGASGHSVKISFHPIAPLARTGIAMAGSFVSAVNNFLTQTALLRTLRGRWQLLN
jgi:hypothetical protein